MKELNISKGAGKLKAPIKLTTTVCVKLEMTQEVSLKLEKTRQLYRDACNFLVPFARTNPKERNWQRFNLHHKAYYALREAIPSLGSQLACNAIRSVSSAYKTKLSNQPRQKKEEELKTIVFKNPSIHLDKNTIRYSDDLSTATIFTVDGRVCVKLCPGSHQLNALNKGKMKESNLVLHRSKRGTYWALHISVESETGIEELKQSLSKSGVLGVDVGENNIAAISSGKIWKAGQLKFKRDKYLGLRARLQRNGSQSARQHLKKASGRERRHVTHENHVVSKQVVEQAIKQNASVIVLEDLTHIRERIKAGKRVKARLHRWAFKELQQQIEYKAHRKGLSVIYVDPRYTSQTCSACGEIGKRTKHRFVCPSCGLRAHSDLNASQNLQGLGYQLIAQGLL